MTTKQDHTLVVLGAGYAGVLAANRLAGEAGHGTRVLLVSDRDELVHRVRLHEVAAGHPGRRYPLAELVSPRVERVHARVDRIDAARRRLVLADRERGSIAYDQLIYAVGSALVPVVPGAREHGMALASPQAAERFAAKLGALPVGAPVVVIGAGLSGIEVAAEIAEAHPGLEVTLLGEALAPDWPEQVREHARNGLADLHVRLRSGVRVRAVHADAVELGDGERVPASAVVWATGFAASPLARASGLPVDELGRLLVDETLRVPEHPEIVGAGDAVAAPLICVGTGITPARMACATAMPMGAHAADVVLATLRGRTPRPFRYHNTFQCVSLGRRAGLLVFIDRDDRPTGRVLAERSGALAKELICRMVIGSLRLERQLPGLFTWLGRRSSLPARLGPGPAGGLLAEGDTVAS